MTGRRAFITIYLLLISVAAYADDVRGCAATIKDLRALVGDPAFSSRWAEASMDDGKPMVVSIFEHNGILQLQFIKTGEGLWAEISGVICKNGHDLEARLSKEQITVGPAAHWMFGLAIANGAVFTLRRRLSNQLQIETQGWRGSFVPSVMK